MDLNVPPRITEQKPTPTEAQLEVHPFGSGDATPATEVLLSRRIKALERLVGELEAALGSHEEVGQAVGVLVASHHVPPQQAFAILKSASQHTNLKMRRLARALVDLHARAPVIDGPARDAVVTYLMPRPV